LLMYFKRITKFQVSRYLSFPSFFVILSSFYLLIVGIRGLIYLIILRHATVGRTPLDEGSARNRDLYQTTHNVHKRRKFMSPVGLEPTIPASKRPQTHALDRAATRIGFKIKMDPDFLFRCCGEITRYATGTKCTLYLVRS